jgi:hypothetical protein
MILGIELGIIILANCIIQHYIRKEINKKN